MRPDVGRVRVGERELRDLELVPLRAGAVEHKELEDAAAPRVEGEWHALRLVHGDGAQRLLASAMGVDELRLACAAAPAAEAGADPKFVPAFGKSALDIARTNNRAGILRLFGDE